MLEGWMSPYDGTVTRKVRAARMPILGKTNLDEFAMGSSNEHSAFDVVRNPWALDRAPGGSGGGSASAVAAFQAPLALGTDTGGSIRQPASLTGSVGVKPTFAPCLHTSFPICLLKFSCNSSHDWALSLLNKLRSLALYRKCS